MRHVVVEFGSREIDPVADAFATLAGGSGSTIRVLPQKTAESLEFADTEASVDVIFSRLRRGSLASAQLRPDHDPSALAIVQAPHFLGSKLGLWYCAFEFDSEDEDVILEKIADIQGLRFASIAVDDGLDLEVKDVTEESFPWQHWRLILGGVRSESGEWIVREGPARIA